MGRNWKRKVSAQPVYENRFDLDDDLDGDESRLRVRSATLESADNQIRDYPPATETYRRLIAEGISESDARAYIAHLLLREIWWIMHEKLPFNRERYNGWLERLPELPD